MSTKGDLNPREQRFADEYLIDFNATQAAIRAGYSKKTARAQASRLLTRVNVQTAIQRALKRQQLRTEITADRVLKELALVAFSDMADHVEVGPEGEVKIKSFTEMPEGASRTISKIKEVRRILGSGEGDGKEMILEARLEYGHHDKIKALELLGKHLGILKEKVEHTGKDGGPIEVKAIEVTFVKPTQG